MIYGRAEKPVSQDGLLQMREVTFDLPPERLRKVAAFLRSAADDLESGNFRTDHRHLDTAGNDWPDPSDVIVCGPVFQAQRDRAAAP